MRSVFLILLASSSLMAAEPSAFGAGNLDNPAPYGLTDTEKHILKNKKTLDAVKQQSRDTETQVDSLRERIDGMQSIVEGLNEKSHENRRALDELKSAAESDRNARGDAIKQLEASVKSNETNILQLKQVLEEFSGMIDKINSNYVTKDEYNGLVREINDFKKVVSGEMKKIAVPGKSASGGGSSLDKMSKADIAKEAKALYEKEHYTKAIEYYEYLIEKNYRPARAHYMVGEMWFARKDYSKAIAYFKQSAQLFSKADYMPTLMLHTAMSMQATNDVKNAKVFYSGVVAQFPESKEAATAADRLRQLK